MLKFNDIYINRDKIFLIHAEAEAMIIIPHWGNCTEEVSPESKRLAAKGLQLIQKMCKKWNCQTKIAISCSYKLFGKK